MQFGHYSGDCTNPAKPIKDMTKEELQVIAEHQRKKSLQYTQSKKNNNWRNKNNWNRNRYNNNYNNNRKNKYGKGKTGKAFAISEMIDKNIRDSNILEEELTVVDEEKETDETNEANDETVIQEEVITEFNAPEQQLIMLK